MKTYWQVDIVMILMLLSYNYCFSLQMVLSIIIGFTCCMIATLFIPVNRKYYKYIFIMTLISFVYMLIQGYFIPSKISINLAYISAFNIYSMLIIGIKALTNYKLRHQFHMNTIIFNGIYLLLIVACLLAKTDTMISASLYVNTISRRLSMINYVSLIFVPVMLIDFIVMLTKSNKKTATNVHKVQQ